MILSKWLRKTNFTSSNDGYKGKTQQEHQKLICDFAKFHNIHWSRKESFNIGWGIWTQVWPGRLEFERTNLQIDRRIQMKELVYDNWLWVLNSDYSVWLKLKQVEIVFKG